MERADAIARRAFEHARNDRMDQAFHAAADHAHREPYRDRRMLAIGFADASRMPQEQVVQRRNRLLHDDARSEEHTSELQSLMRISYAVFCLKKKTTH